MVDLLKSLPSLTQSELLELLPLLSASERLELDQLLLPVAPTSLAGYFNVLQIVTKRRELITFAPNHVQCLYLDIICPAWRTETVELRGIREILLKARQFGFSTLILALFFIDTITTPNTQTVVIAHDIDTTEKLFRMVKRYHEHLPDSLKLETKYANRREFLWPSIDSYFFVGTAGNKSFGRGGTINNVHGSEVAFWPNADDIVSGLLQTVPTDGNIFLETTANGVGNYYEREYKRAELGNSVFTSRFFAWFQNPEYATPITDNAFVLDADEAKIAETYDLSNAQMLWRRGKVKELREKFAQEYPANADEAFLTSGNPYFDRDYLREIKAAIQTGAFPPITSTVPAQYDNLRIAQGAGLTVWELPTTGKTYVIGADTAEGLTDSGDHDFDCADVFDADSWTQVAQLHGKWDTHTYGLMLADLGKWYNTALLGIERNNHGHAVINAALYTAKYPEARNSRAGLYFHQEYDETKKPAGMKAGWPTTVKTKYFALDGLATNIHERELHLRSLITVSELLTFVKLPGGKAGGDGSSHDDAVMSCAIASALLTNRPRGGWAQNPQALDYLRQRQRGNNDEQD